MANLTPIKPIITLPLLVAYLEELVPSLLKSSNTQATIKNDNHADVLWAVADQEAAITVSKYLQDQRGKTTSEFTHQEISTIEQLKTSLDRQRYELVCFWLPELSKEQWQPYIPLLMHYRDLYAAHLLIAIDRSIDLRAYGFTPFDILEGDKLETIPTILNSQTQISPRKCDLILWQFNLYDYKQLPNWLNADYWANPENWNRFRW